MTAASGPHRMNEDLFRESGAVLDGLYRYALWRRWSPLGAGRCAFVMLNPSTADATQDDQTIRKCIAWAQRRAYDSIEVVNLFAFRATDPKELQRHVKAGRPLADLIGPKNDDYIMDVARSSQLVVCAWGVHGTLGARDTDVRKRLAWFREKQGVDKVRCLGRTKDGLPKHPLYLPLETCPIFFE